MPSRLVWLVPLLVWICSMPGCSTVPEKSAAAGVASTKESPGIPAAERIESPEETARRADAHARFMSAVTRELNNELEAASVDYEKALELDPSNETLALDLSRRFIAQKQFDRAAALLKKAADSPEASAAVLTRLGMVYAQLGKTNEAIAVNEQAIKRQPKSIAGYQSLYTFYRQTGLTNEARRVLTQASKQEKPDAAFLVDLAMLYFLEDTPKSNQTNILVSPRAKDALERAMKMSPTNLMVLQKLAQGLRLAGEPKKASEVYSRLIKEYPRMPGLREELTELLLRSNDTKGAAEQLELLIRENPTNPQAYFYLGAIAYDEHRYADAVENYRKALLLNPENEQLYYDIAAAKIAMNEPGEALEYIRQAQKRFKQSFVSEFFSGVAYMRLKDYTNAVLRFSAAEVIGSATETNRLNHSFYFQFGAASERAGKIAEAETLFRKCLSMSPEFPEALNYLGYMWAERGTNLAEARVMIERAVQMAPTNSAYLDSLGWVLFKQGNAQEALPQIEKAIQFNDEPDATLYDHLGDILSALKQPEKARDAWKKAIGIEPNPEIEKKLKEPPRPGG